MRQLSPQDAQFLYMEDGQVASHITSIGVCDQSTAPGGVVRFKDILNLVEERLAGSIIYNQKLKRVPLELDHPYWVEDPHFDREYHVTHGRLPEPQDWRQFCIHMARFHSRPLNLSRPPWELFVVEGLGKIEGLSESAFAIAVKIHHAAVDGVSAQEFVASLMDFGPDGPPVLPDATRRRRKIDQRVTTPEMLTRAWFHNTLAPAKFARAAAKFAPRAAKAVLSGDVLRGRGDSIQAPHTRFNGDVSPHRAFDAAVFKLDEFKRIKDAFSNAKINDVVIAACGGALRKYLQAKNELPSESLIATAPVNLRPNSADPVGAKADGNNISALSIPVFTNIGDASERLKAVVRATRAAKGGKSGLAGITTDLTREIAAAPQSLLTRLAMNNSTFANRVCNLIISNVATSPAPFYFCGAKITHQYGMAPIGGGMGLFIATPSYAGEISFCLTTTRDIIPDTPFFIDCLKEAVADLSDAANRKTKKRRKSKRAAAAGKKFKVRPPLREQQAEHEETVAAKKSPGAKKGPVRGKTKSSKKKATKSAGNGDEAAIPTHRSNATH